MEQTKGQLAVKRAFSSSDLIVLAATFFVFFIAFVLGGFAFVHWLQTGTITPYKSFGIIALALSGMALLLVILALIGDMLNRIRHNQEKILYLLKKNYFEKD